MYSTLCQMKCLVHIKPQEKLCEGKLNSKQKVLYGHLVLFFFLSFCLSRSPLSPKVINKTPHTSLTWTETPKGISLSLGFYPSRSFTQAYKSPGPAHVFPSPSTLWAIATCPSTSDLNLRPFSSHTGLPNMHVQLNSGTPTHSNIRKPKCPVKHSLSLLHSASWPSVLGREKRNATGKTVLTKYLIEECAKKFHKIKGSDPP